MKPLGLCNIVFLLAISTGVSSAAEIDGRLFQQDLHHLAEGVLGIQQFQSHVDEQSYIESELNGATLISELADSLKFKFQERMNVANELQKELRDLYKSTGHVAQPQKCCDVPVDQTDERFGRGKINLNTICTSGPGETPDNTFLSEAIINSMKNNLEANPLIKWQYFGSADGTMAKYPASDFCSATYDPRLRPWYSETATPEPKDVVIILDTSGSMGSTKPGEGGSRLDIAVNAAITVIDTLNAEDRVGVVAFSDTAVVPPGNDETSKCYKQELARAIPVNTQYLSNFVTYLNTGSETEYILGLQAAFDYFMNTPTMDNEAKKRHRIILFLTDGDPTDTTGRDGILNTLRDRNAMLNNTVVIFTYGIGDITDNGGVILNEMAEQVKYNQTFGEPRVGKYTKVADLKDLRYVMATFYNFFSSGEIPSPIFSVPYMDAFGIGLVTSACLPVYESSTLRGVTCLDIAIGDLLSDLTYFRQGELSYAFIIDDEGLLLIHPLLPGPQDVTDDPVYLLMTSVERADEARHMMDSMMQGDTGNVSMKSFRVRAKGNVDFTGVQWDTLVADYIWENIEGTEFSICIVIGHSDKQASLVDAETFSKTFTYHRLDLKPPSNSCKHLNRLSLKDRSTVKFTGDAFVSPFAYQDLVETKEDVDKYELYLTGSYVENDAGFKHGVRNNVVMTTKFDAILMEKKAYENAVWFYIGTVDGIFRIFPGVQLPKMYDHKFRSWYKKTEGQKGLLTISTPYEDAFGAGLIITLGHAIFEGRIEHQSDDPLVGVIAMDFRMLYLYNLLTTRFPQCEQDHYSCFLLDVSGFIVVHKDFSQTSDASDIENLHITVKEQYIAQDLINESLMKRSSCINLELFRYQYVWTVSIPGGAHSRVKDDYEIHEVEGSNIFVVMRKYIGSKPAMCYCRTNKGMKELGECALNTDEQVCQCPCYNRVQHNYCSGQLDLDFDDPPPCTPPLPNIDLEHVLDAEQDIIKTRDDCFDYKCQEKTTHRNCTALAVCIWCEVDPDVRCTSYDGCNSEGRNSINIIIVIASVIGGLVGMGLLVGFMVVLKKRCKTTATNNDKARTVTRDHENHDDERPGGLNLVAKDENHDNECPDGLYSEANDENHDDECPGGLYSEANDENHDDECPGGLYSEANDENHDDECPGGLYSEANDVKSEQF